MNPPTRPVVTLTLAHVLAAALGLALALAAESPAAPGIPDPSEEPRLIAILRQPDASDAAQSRACQNLSLIGTAEAVPALAALLDHPRLSHYARTALEAIPDAAATDALRAAVDRLQGPLLVGVVHSLAVRKDMRSVAALIRLSADPARGAAAEALLALGRLDSPESRRTILRALDQGPPELRTAAGEACLLLAEGAVDPGPSWEALRLFDAIRAAPVPSPLKAAALRGRILANRAEGIPLLVAALRDPDPGSLDMALRIVREWDAPGVTATLAGALPGLPPALQIQTLDALGERADPLAGPAVAAWAESTNAAVRLAAWKALGTVGGARAFPLLIRALSLPSTEEAEAAASSLVRLRHNGLDDALLAALNPVPASAPARARLLAVLGQRQPPGATDRILPFTADPDPAVVSAAFEALAAVAPAAELPAVTRAAVVLRDPDLRTRAERTLYAIAVKEPRADRRSDVLVSAYDAASDLDARLLVLQVLAMLGDPTAARTVSQACDAPEPVLRDAALRLLVQWSAPTPTPTLLRVFKTTTNAVHRALALEGVVRLATGWTDPANRPAGGSAPLRPPAESIAWLSEANAALRNQPEEKRVILSGLGDLNCPEGLRLLEPYLADPTVRKEASQAVLRAAAGLASADERRAARPLLERIVNSPVEEPLRRQATELLQRTP